MQTRLWFGRPQPNQSLPQTRKGRPSPGPNGARHAWKLPSSSQSLSSASPFHHHSSLCHAMPPGRTPLPTCRSSGLVAWSRAWITSSPSAMASTKKPLLQTTKHISRSSCHFRSSTRYSSSLSLPCVEHQSWFPWGDRHLKTQHLSTTVARPWRDSTPGSDRNVPPTMLPC